MTSGQETEWIYSKPQNPHGVLVRVNVRVMVGVMARVRVSIRVIGRFGFALGRVDCKPLD